MTEEQRIDTVLSYDTAVTIADGDQTSGGTDLKGMTLVGLLMPAAFTGTAVTFLSAESLTGTYRAVTDGAGADYEVTAAAGKHVPVDPVRLCGVRFLRLESDAVEAADREITLALRRV